MADSTRILFVCLGNIVRSPLAEAMLAKLADDSGVGDKYEVDSAGTAGYHVGDSPDSRMRAVAAAKGLVYDGSGRQFIQDDFDRFDLIVAMDKSNRANILSLARNPGEIAKVHLLREFDESEPSADEVPDPYYGGIDGFEHVYEIVANATKGLFNALEAGEISY